MIDREPAPESGDGAGLAPRPPARRAVRWALNALLLFHVAAIAVAPAAVEPASDLAHSAWELFAPYLQALHLNNGYHFFAPEPTESTLIAFEAERADGTVVRGRFPDRSTRPRLLYHRHFMLSEHLGDAPPEARDAWHDSIARHLGHAHGAVKVRLTEVTHLLSTPERIRDGARLDDPESYEERPLGEFACDGD